LLHEQRYSFAAFENYLFKRAAWHFSVRALGNFRPPPGAKVYCIQHQAKYVGGDEPHLRCLESDDANNNAVDSCEDPAFPTPPANQDGGNDGQDARDIIQTKHNGTSASII
jgi:hypothetical protein